MIGYKREQSQNWTECRKQTCLVDGDGSARGLDETVVGRALTADGGVLADVLDGDTDQDRDLLAVKADSTVKDLVESETETGKGILSLVALLLLVSKSLKRRRMCQIAAIESEREEKNRKLTT